MKFVVDTNVILSLFKSNSYTSELIESYSLELYSPKELLDELQKYSEIICYKSKITKEKFNEKLSLLSKIINFISPKSEFKKQASELLSDKKDVPFLALALELKIPVWTNDRGFKQQSKIPVFDTSELKSFLES